MLFAKETHRTEPSPGCADTAGSRHRQPNTVLGSRNVPGLAGETITSAGNRLVHSGFHAGRKPPEPGLSKPTCVGTGDAAVEGVRPPSRHQCRSQEDQQRSSRAQRILIPSSNTRHGIYIYVLICNCKLTELCKIVIVLN